MSHKVKFLAPGSEEAIEAGCTCPVLDNCHGAGYLGKAGVYVFNSGCPIHAPQVKAAREKP